MLHVHSRLIVAWCKRGIEHTCQSCCALLAQACTSHCSVIPPFSNSLHTLICCVPCASASAKFTDISCDTWCAESGMLQELSTEGKEVLAVDAINAWCCFLDLLGASFLTPGTAVGPAMTQVNQPLQTWPSCVASSHKLADRQC